MGNIELNNDPESLYRYMLRKDKSLIYIGVIAATIVLVMAYLTFFVDDASTLLSRKKAVVPVAEQKTKLLEESSGMDDEQVRRSLVKFVEAYYHDQRKGYFDPPSYFAGITETYYNFHNLTHQRLKDIHWMRMEDMRNYELNWIVSSLDFERENEQLIVTYWTRVSYFKPSKNAQESGDIRNEMIINENGKIISLRELEVKNFTSYVVEDTIDSLIEELPRAETTPIPVSQAVEPAAKYEGKLYDLGTVEGVPEFTGGQRELSRYLATNLKYPAAARQNNVQGKVYVSFVVEKNGDLSGIYVIKGIGGGCDEEAMKVLRNSPAWKPGTVAGKPVRTSYTLPITFRMIN
ncbi:MAG TPA: energy transducer TonB [Sphingobacteriaceae bacterium]